MKPTKNCGDCWRKPTTMPAFSLPESAREAADALDRIGEGIDRCRLTQACDPRVCGPHAVGKPTYQLGPRSEILVAGEAPGPAGWWLTGRAFHCARADGQLRLSQTGENLNACLAV